MKTPREIILESHRAVEPRLDRLRETVLAAELATALSGPKVRPQSAGNILQKLWLELIWPSRRAWAGLSAVWVVLGVVYLSTLRPNEPRIAPLQPASDDQLGAGTEASGATPRSSGARSRKAA